MQVEGMTGEEEQEEFKEEVDTSEDVKVSPKLNVENPIPSKNKHDSKMNSKQYRDRKKDFDFLKNKYSEVLKIQEKIMSNVGSLEGSMSDMDKMVDDVKKNLSTIRDTIPA